MHKDISLVIVSCDKYKDLWDSFFYFFKKYWSNCSLQTYLITNFIDYKGIDVVTIQIGDDKSYTENLLSAIEQVPSDWILLWLEDCMFSHNLDLGKIDQVLSTAISTPNLGYLKLSNDLPISYDCPNSFFGKIPKGVKYRSAIGMALYRKDVLKKLLVPGENAWQADKSAASDDLVEDFYALASNFFKNPLFPYVNTVVKGEWSWAAIKILRKNGFLDLISYREPQSLYGYLYERLFYFWSYYLVTFRIYWYK